MTQEIKTSTSTNVRKWSTRIAGVAALGAATVGVANNLNTKPSHPNGEHQAIAQLTAPNIKGTLPATEAMPAPTIVKAEKPVGATLRSQATTTSPANVRLITPNKPRLVSPTPPAPQIELPQPIKADIGTPLYVEAPLPMPSATPEVSATPTPEPVVAQPIEHQIVNDENPAARVIAPEQVDTRVQIVNPLVTTPELTPEQAHQAFFSPNTTKTYVHGQAKVTFLDPKGPRETWINNPVLYVNSENNEVLIGAENPKAPDHFQLLDVNGGNIKYEFQTGEDGTAELRQFTGPVTPVTDQVGPYGFTYARNSEVIGQPINPPRGAAGESYVLTWNADGAFS